MNMNLRVAVLIVVIGVAAAQDFEVCTYSDAGCQENEVCTGGDNGLCLPVAVEDSSGELGALVQCNEERMATYSLYFVVDCGGSNPVNGTATVDQCFRLKDTEIWFAVRCSDSNVCFSKDSTINMEDLSVKTLDEVRVGDSVESFDSAGRKTFSKVFLIQHAGEEATSELYKLEYYVEATQTRGSITVSPKHLLRAAKHSDVFLPASKMLVGSAIFVMPENSTEGVDAEVVAVTKVWTAVRNVHTMNDRVVVNGVMASSMQDFGPFQLLRGALLPIKGLYYVGMHNLVSAIDQLLHRFASNAPVARFLKI